MSLPPCARSETDHRHDRITLLPCHDRNGTRYNHCIEVPVDSLILAVGPSKPINSSMTTVFFCRERQAPAMPLPVNTGFAHTEVRILHAELKPDLVLAARQQLSSLVGIVNGLIGQNVLID